MDVMAFGLRRRCPRFAAMVAVLVLLVGQSLGAVHWHRNTAVSGVSTTDQATPSDSGLCPVCLSVFHAPLAPAAAASLERPLVVFEAAVASLVVVRCSPFLSSPPGRGPPASV